MRVFKPGVGAAGFGNDRPKFRIGQHVDPGRGRHLASRERDDILVAVARETAETIVENQIARRRWRGSVDPRRPARRERWHQRLEHTALFELLDERAMLVIEHDASSGLEEEPVVVRDLFQSPNENAAGLVQHLRLTPGGDQVLDLILQILPVNRDVFVQDDHLDGQTFRAPVGVRLDHLLHHLDLLRVGDAQDDERRVAGNAVSPKAALSAAIIEQHAGRGASRGIGVNDRAGETGVELGIGLGEIELAQSHLAMRPGEIEHAVGHARVLIFFHERERCLARFGNADDEVDHRGFVRRENHTAPQ